MPVNTLMPEGNAKLKIVSSNMDILSFFLVRLKPYWFGLLLQYVFPYRTLFSRCFAQVGMVSLILTGNLIRLNSLIITSPDPNLYT